MAKTLVQASDNHYYVEPVLYGPDWFINFPEAIPRLVVAGTAKVAAKTYGRAEITRRNIPMKLRGDGERVSEVFPPDMRGFKNAYAFVGELVAPIPVPNSSGGRVGGPSWDSEFIGFSVEFGVADLTPLFTRGGSPPDYLMAFMTGKRTWTVDADKHKQKVRNAVLRQYPALREAKVIDAANMRALLGTTVIRLQRLK